MISRVLKIELLFFFLLTALSFCAFYYQDSLPDNFYSISSSSQNFNIISYYSTTAIAFIGYYTGPWPLFLFIIYSLFFSLIYSRRNCFFDIFNILFLLVFGVSFTQLFFPAFMGPGAQHLLRQYLSSSLLSLIAFSSLVAFLAGSFRSSFKDRMLQLFKLLYLLIPQIFKLLKKAFNKIDFKRPAKEVQKIQGSYRSLVKVKIPSFLKGEERKTAPLEEEVIEENETQEKIEEPLPTEQEDKVEEATESVKVVAPKKSKKKDSDGIYFDIVSDMNKSKKNHAKQSHPEEDYFSQIKERIEETLKAFGLEGAVVGVLKGPVVDTFLLELGKGVKVSRVTNIYQDLCVALYGAPIRIVYPMKGRTTVGIEVPRNPREIIYLDEVFHSDEFKKADNISLPIAMGKDAYGEVFVVDLVNMPHMLVAGATGSGKSVFINTLLVSLLAKKSPSQMKLILIDPKQLELVLYSKLPHLCMPVIMDAKRASLSLKWAVEEMERRYQILKECSVRNLDGFNSKIRNAPTELIAKIAPFYDESYDSYELPYIVIIVDEFADLILSKSGKEIENDICKLAGKARAAGIHLIVATQRPSVDVITGLIKANFPTRVSFRVSTNVDSRTILSAMGAEKLLGKGDMLYKRGVETIRVHSAYVDENEIEEFVDKMSALGSQYDVKAVEFLEKNETAETYSGGLIDGEEFDGPDPRFEEAVKVVMEHRAASASMLQRRLRIGYNRAANLIEEMEAKGIVGPAQGAKPRKVLGYPEQS